MRERDLYLASDAALRSVIDRMTLTDFGRTVPPEWSSGHRSAAVTLRDIVARHAYDEAWVPDLIDGRTIEEVGDRWSGDLLGDDPIAAYDALNDAATAAASRLDLDPEAPVHFSYGDYPLAEAFAHLSMYRTFQSWQIARHLGLDFHLPDAVIDGTNELVMPSAELWRSYGVFPPAIEPPAEPDAETRLLCAAGYWHP
ncbi:MAG: hypothetical protein M3N46_12430 [Actinomycetota bacterium]|nr:hypothetical protein [Actinomycetota bacterium]